MPKHFRCPYWVKSIADDPAFRYSISCDIANFFTAKNSRESSIKQFMKYILFWIAEKYTSCTIVIASLFFETTYTILSVDIGLLSLASKDIMQMD